MKSNEVNQNLRLGLFVLIGIVVFLAGVFYLGSQNNIFNRTFTTYAVFKNVEGLNRGDNVWLSGVKIGTVREVAVASEGRVLVEMALKENQTQFIRKNATALIGSDGLVGSKIVIIRPGDAQVNIAESDTINTESPTDTQELFDLARDVGENTRSLTTQLRTMVEKLNRGEGVFGELLTDEGPVSRDIRYAVDRFKATSVQAARASQQLQEVMYQVNNGDGLIARLVTDTTLVEVFDETLANIKKVSANSAQMSENLEQLIAKTNNDDNTLGVVLSDTVFANRVKATVRTAQDAAVKLDENLEAMRHNFLFRRYFRKKEKRERKAREEAAEQAAQARSGQ